MLQYAIYYLAILAILYSQIEINGEKTSLFSWHGSTMTFCAKKIEIELNLAYTLYRL